jgi:hypothetical protein
MARPPRSDSGPLEPDRAWRDTFTGSGNNAIKNGT